MRWTVFAVFAWLLLGLEAGFKDVLQLGSSGIAPSFVIPFAVFIALTAPPTAAVWACLILGLGLDLTTAVPVREGAIGSPTLVGPYALGLALAAQLVLAIRGMLMRHNPLTMGAISFLASCLLYLVVAAMLAVRILLPYRDPIAMHTWSELLGRLGSATYTGILAVLMALALFKLAPLFGLHTGHSRHQVSIRRD
jgi:fucose 4-O-acetylase-like acetyltransferase